MTEQLQGDTFTMVPLNFEEVFPTIENREVDFFLVSSSMFVTANVKYGALQDSVLQYSESVLSHLLWASPRLRPVYSGPPHTSDV